jgi:hypothetical protein
MKTDTIGRYAAAGYPVLKDIFEANLELLEQEERKKETSDT